MAEASPLIGAVLRRSLTWVGPVGTWWNRAFSVALAWYQIPPLEHLVRDLSRKWRPARSDRTGRQHLQ